MLLTKIVIKNFKSIESLTLHVNKSNLICGPNSTGKTNILQAIKFGLSEEIGVSDIEKNMNSKAKAKTGGCRLKVELTFEDINEKLKQIFSIKGNKAKLVLNASTSKIYTWKFADKDIKNNPTLREKLISNYIIVYIPPIRNLETEENPINEIFKSILENSKEKNIREARTQLIDTLKEKGDDLLGRSLKLGRNITDAVSVKLDKELLAQNVNSLDNKIKLNIINHNHEEISVNDLGTGHQSMLLFDIYKIIPKHVPSLVLFEEPDNHLHPSAIKSLADQLNNISDNEQIIITSHSPILINNLYDYKIVSILNKEESGTSMRQLNIDSKIFNTPQKRTHYIKEFGIHFSTPLLVDKIIIVEGWSDYYVISNLLIESRKEINKDYTIISANGKKKILDLLSLIIDYDINPFIMIDNDAFEIRENIYQEPRNLDNNDINDAVNLIKSMLNNTREAKKIIRRLEQLTNNYTVQNTVKSEPLIEKIAKKKKTKIDWTKDNNKHTQIIKHLKKQNIFVLTSEIEGLIIGTAKAKAVITEYFKELYDVEISANEIIDKLHESILSNKTAYEILDKTKKNRSSEMKELVREIIKYIND